MTGTRKAAVLGYPAKHSLSPQVHGFWLARHRIDGRYEAIEVRPEAFAAELARLRDAGYRGANVTLPHKEAALAAMDGVDALARRIGAVNTVVFAADGKMFGSNTDGFGFLENLHAQSSWQAADGPAILLGAGGAAKAIAVALLDAGVPRLDLVNRTEDRAAALARALGDDRVRVTGWDRREEMLAGAALLVNATSLGMAGKAPLALSLDALSNRAVVNDIVYVPLETPLLAAARRRGNRVVDGLGMLIHQARPGFEAWFGQAPDVSPDALAALRRTLLDALAAREKPAGKT